jgi:hypothetical protein
VQPVLVHPSPVVLYEPKSWGPAAAVGLADPYGGWYDPLAMT